MSLRALYARFRPLFAYALLGGSAALAEWLTYYFCSLSPELSVPAKTTLAFLAGTLFNWAMGRLTLFRAQARARKSWRDALYVFAASLAGLGINQFCMHAFVSWLDMHEMLSKVLSTGIAFFWNYFARRCIIYPQKYSRGGGIAQ